MIASIELRERVGALFHRRPTTPWSHKEARVYAQIVKHGLRIEDLEMIERYYVYQRKRENGIHRRDLYTFLNNFSGELDRARAWDEEMRERLKRKVRYPRLAMIYTDKPIDDKEWQRISDLAKKELERFKSCFAKATQD